MTLMLRFLSGKLGSIHNFDTDVDSLSEVETEFDSDCDAEWALSRLRLNLIRIVTLMSILSEADS